MLVSNWLLDLEKYIGTNLCDSIKSLPRELLSRISEIRFSTQGNAFVTANNKIIILKDKNGFEIKLKQHEIQNIFLRVCDGAVFKFESQIKNGFITIPGGHRVGFCGTAVYSMGELITIKNITSICIRISRSVINSAREIIASIISDDIIHSTLIVSPPGGGKTTVLTDVSRLLSQAQKKCAVIDERGEICSVRNGIPQKEVGKFTSVFDGYSKAEGMMIALRTLSPDVIICDEIGTYEEVEQITEAMNAGVPVIVTAHARNFEELVRRPQIQSLLDFGCIEKVIILKGSDCPGSVKEIVNIRVNSEDHWDCIDCD